MSKSKPNKPKVYDLTEEEISEIVFHTRIVKEKQIDLRLWEAELQKSQVKVEQRLAIDPSKHVLDWSKLFQTGKVYKHLKPEVQANAEEKNAEQELQKKQKKGKRNKK